MLFWAPPQQAQNPSPMVEHTRVHRRLKEEHPAGERKKLDLGTLYLPAGKPRAILLFFHGGTWLPEVAAARNKIAVLSVQAGSGSGTYAKLFEDPARFGRLLAELPPGRVLLGGWSAGCGAIRQILKNPESYARIDGVLCIDGIHTDYAEGKPGPIGVDNLKVWEQVGRDAMGGRKRVLITHSEIFPGTFASTTETADWLVAALGLKRTPVLKWGPVGLQQLSLAEQGNFRLLGFAGNSAPDHVDQLHALPDWLRWLVR